MKDTVCCGCSVVCDDVAVSIKKGEFRSLGLCRLGHEYCGSVLNKDRLTKPLVKDKMRKQRAVPLNKAFEEANSILAESEKPLLLGWSNSPVEVIQLGIKLTRQVKGVFDTTASFEYGNLLKYKLFGGEKNDFSLDDVRNYADHIVYWGVNPAESHHRHASRYTVFPKGEKIPEGRESRIVSVLDIRETESMRLANHQLILDASKGDEHFLRALIEEINGTASTPPKKIGGVPAIEFLSFAKQLQESEYIVLFYGNGLLHTLHAPETLPLFAKLSSSLNKGKRRCITLPMVTYCNTIGAVKTSLEETKLPFSIDFTSNSPKSCNSIFPELEACEFDMALIMGWDGLSFLPGPIARALKQIPLIVSSTHPTLTTRHASIVFPTALTGAEVGGTVYRMDGTAVSLQPFRTAPSTILSEAQLLEQLIKKLM